MVIQEKVETEQDLIRRILSGDEAAKTSFYRSHVGRIRPICIHFLGYNDADIDDVLQETFLTAFKKLPSFEPRCTLYTWVAHICVNYCYQRLHKRNRALIQLEADLEKAARPLAQARAADRDADEEKGERIALLERLMEGLTEKCRTVLRLRDLKGESYVSICRTLKIPMGTVMSQLARCRDSLRKLALKAREGEA